MKKGFALMAIILFLALKPFSFGETEIRSELDPFLQLFEEQDIQLDEWKLYTRGKINQFDHIDDFEKSMADMKRKMTSFQWEEIDTPQKDDHLHMTGTYTHPTLPLEETLSVYSYPSRQHSYHMYVSYEIIAKPKDNEHYDWNEIQQNWNENVKNLYKDKPQVFTLVKGKNQNNMVGDLYEHAQVLMHELGAEKIEELNEATFVSISAYNDHWANTIISNGNKMNLQIGLRQGPVLGGETTVTIGTPIITTEY